MDSYENQTESTVQNVTDGIFGLDNQGSGNSYNYKHIYEIVRVGKYALVAVSSLGIVTNLLTFLTMVTSKRLRNYPSGILIITLAVVDCLVTILQLVQLKTIFHHVRLFLPLRSLEIIISSFWISMVHASILILLLISINRYVIVCRPLHHHRVTSNKSVLFQLIVVLLCSFVTSVVVLFVTVFTIILCATIIAIVTIMILVLTICVHHSLSQSNHPL